MIVSKNSFKNNLNEILRLFFEIQSYIIRMKENHNRNERENNVFHSRSNVFEIDNKSVP